MPAGYLTGWHVDAVNFSLRFPCVQKKLSDDAIG
jgi:hypothetical protein